MKLKAFFITSAVLVVLLTAHISNAWSDAEGFLGLKWGVSEEEAKKVFNDLELTFKRSEKREVNQPWNGYIRKNEPFKLGELPGESVTYYFSNQGLDGITAKASFVDSERSSVPGKYKELKQRFLSSYEVLKKNIVSEYGEPESEEAVAGYICTWKLSKSNIMLAFFANDMDENYIYLELSHFYKPESKGKRTNLHNKK
jgi:hypothetical protein